MENCSEYNRIRNGRYRFPDGTIIDPGTLRVLLIDSAEGDQEREREIEKILSIEAEGAEEPLTRHDLRKMLFGENVPAQPTGSFFTDDGALSREAVRYLLSREAPQGGLYRLYDCISSTRKTVAHILLKQIGPEVQVIRHTVRADAPHRGTLHHLIINDIQRRMRLLETDDFAMLTVLVPHRDEKMGHLYAQHSFRKGGTRHPELDPDHDLWIWDCSSTRKREPHS